MNHGPGNLKLILRFDGGRNSFMWLYEKKLQFPVKIKNPNPKMAKLIITQYGGPDGELAASLRYLSQRFAMVTPQAIATLNDIGTEELAHLEVVGAIVYQLMKDASIEEIKEAGAESYFVDHDRGIFPVDANGVPFTAAYIQSKGNPVVDLNEDLAAEQKARATYEYLITLADDPDVIEPLKFLREREVIHYQRFGEALRIVQDYLQDPKLFIMPKPDFMKK
jgi:spore coat protein JC